MEQVLSGQRQCSAQGKGQSPATPDKHISGSKSIRASSHTLCRIQLLQLGFLCHSDWKDESKLKSLDTHPKQDILKKTRSISKELSGWNYYWRWDLWKQRVPTGHNLLRCCISAAWALQGILPLRSRLSETRMALYCWVSAWEILNPGRAE